MRRRIEQELRLVLLLKKLATIVQVVNEWLPNDYIISSSHPRIAHTSRDVAVILQVRIVSNKTLLLILSGATVHAGPIVRIVGG